MTLRRVSSRRARENRTRRELLERDHGPQRCQWPDGCANAATDPDEILSRARGGSIIDPDNIWLLCRTHHDWKHAHPAEARAMGIYPAAADLARVRHDSYDPIMAQPATHSPKIAIRLSAEGVAFVEKLATETGRSKSDVYRALFSIGSAHRDEVLARLTTHPERNP